MYFITEYTYKGVPFSACLYARNWDDAEEVCKKRGLKERVLGTTDSFSEFDNSIFLPTNSQKLLHLITFCSWIGLKTGVYSIDDILSDSGILHEYIHSSTSVPTITKRQALQKRIEKLIQVAFNLPDNHSVLRLPNNWLV